MFLEDALLIDDNLMAANATEFCKKWIRPQHQLNEQY